ncbi:hypothetical protein H5410_056481 [Solanum commersonii]|uniref:Uncharacterized protein n=1 Tax=Solanum commersonii TaxID=4109 RepID=A0A9J5WKE0_SOLCO|nr:hypothetical protein H5410_056481 [Solanum commersonii]
MNHTDNHFEPSISDLRHEVSSLKEEIRNIKSRLCIIETDILTNQVPKRTTFNDLESNQDSSHEDDDNIGINLSNINNDHLAEPLFTHTCNDTSTSTALGNKYTALADYPKLEAKPPTPTKLINQKIDKGSTSSSVQNKESYTMKAPETFAQAVKPTVAKKPDAIPIKEEFEFTTKQALPIMAIDKQYEGPPIASLIKPVYLNNNFVDTDNPLKTQRYFEAILVDTVYYY